MQNLTPTDDTESLAAARTEVVQELDHFAEAEWNFFYAWKRDVLLSGPRNFGSGTREHFDRAVSKWDLCPRMDHIEQSIGVMSAGEKRFIAALASFYNAEDGGRLLRRAGIQGLADLAGGLDLKRRTVLAALLLHYNGW